jgi:hypothetical protein
VLLPSRRHYNHCNAGSYSILCRSSGRCKLLIFQIQNRHFTYRVARLRFFKESFIREMISIRFPESNLFFYYHSLAIENGTLQKSESVVSARDLRGAILKRLPRYGMRPGHINSIATLSAVLFTMEQGKWARAQQHSLTLSCLYKMCLSGFLDFEILVIHFSFFFRLVPFRLVVCDMLT